MAAIIRPSRTVSFTAHRKGPLPVDLLDAQIQNLIDAIHSTQTALADVRRDDGKLVGHDPIAAQSRPSRDELHDATRKIEGAGRTITDTAIQFAAARRDIELRARDAEVAAFSAQATLSQVTDKGASALDATSDAANSADQAEAAAIAAQNAANYSQAQTDNAIAAKNEATQWAEYLAGPVVNPADAPAYIEGHPFGHGLYYQPVEGFGGNAGLWSAKWWAIYASQLVGATGFYYLGAWAEPPIPGGISPTTGIQVPDPLLPGSFYYDIDAGTIYVWDGIAWNSPYALAAGVTSRFVYRATAGQQVFSGPDYFGNTPVVGQSPSDVHLNGLRLVENIGFVVDVANSQLTLSLASTAGEVVQWDLLVPPNKLAPGAVASYKVILTPAPDGAATTFGMNYIDPVDGTKAVNVSDGSQLQVSIDGIIQEPGVDFTSSGYILSMSKPPVAGARFWAIWFSNTVPIPPTVVGSAPVNTAIPVISGSALQGTVLITTPGVWSGSPSPIYSYQWKSGGVNVGTSASSYATQPSDIGNYITVVVTATNSQGNASATSANFGPIAAIDTTPAAFSFTDITGADVSTLYTSNAITVSGINSPSNLTITGGEYMINGVAWASTPTTVVAGDTVQVRNTSSPSLNTAVNTVLTIGGVTDTFTITTGAGTVGKSIGLLLALTYGS